MLVTARWLAETSVSIAIRQIDWLIPVLQSVHILAIAMLLSSVMMIDLRVLGLAGSRTQSLADAVHRFAAWIWTSLGLLALTGAPLVVAEPRRTLVNGSFQLKLALLVLAAVATCAQLTALRRQSEFKNLDGRAGRCAQILAVYAFLLWCAVATAGRFIAYTQPS